MSGTYVNVFTTDHPLACGGKVGEHRVVLYEKIGPGTHHCHWCGIDVVWVAGSGARSSLAAGTQRLIAAHLDGDRANNAPENVVASCTACSSLRQRAPRRILRAELWRTEARGASWFQLTLECGHAVVRKYGRQKRRACCGICAGVEEPKPPEKRVGLGDAATRAVVPDGGYKFTGTNRRVRKELSYEATPRGGYVSTYLLECGHEVRRNGRDKLWCRCAECG